MKHLGRYLGNHFDKRQLSVLASKSQTTKASRIANVMKAVSDHVPWESKCLAEALCVKFLLNKYKIPCVIYLGAKFDSKNPGQLKAHAWVTVERYTIIGGPQHKTYEVVSSFTEPSFN